MLFLKMFWFRSKKEHLLENTHSTGNPSELSAKCALTENVPRKCIYTSCELCI